MTTPNNDNSFPQPDPAWDYYLTYHSLLKAKSSLKNLIQFISDFESATADISEDIKEDLAKLIAILENTPIPPDEAT